MKSLFLCLSILFMPHSGVYHNYISEVLGISREQVQERMDQLWEQFARHTLRHEYGQFDLDGSNPTGGYSQGMAGANAVGAISVSTDR